METIIGKNEIILSIIFDGIFDGMRIIDWIGRLKENISYAARKILESRSFEKISGVKIDIVIIKGEIFSNDYSLADVYTEAKKRSLREMEVKTAYLTVEKITAADMEAMGLQYIILMHQPIANGNVCMNEYCLFEIVHNHHDCCRLELISDRPEFSKYTSSYGFAFAK